MQELSFETQDPLSDIPRVLDHLRKGSFSFGSLIATPSEMDRFLVTIKLELAKPQQLPDVIRRLLQVHQITIVT